MALSTAERLAASIALTASDLGLSAADYESRIGLWEELAAERTSASPAQQQARVRGLALTAWIVALTKQADKFRAEGEITVESDILGRIALLQGWLATAELETLAPAATARPSRNPAPEFEDWGLR